MFEYLVFNEHESPSSDREIRIEVDEGRLKYRLEDSWEGLIDPKKQEGAYSGDMAAFLEKLEAFGVPTWKDEYYIPACDGYSWELRYKEVARPCRKISGSNDCPDCYDDFVDMLFSIADIEKEGMWT